MTENCQPEPKRRKRPDRLSAAARPVRQPRGGGGGGVPRKHRGEVAVLTGFLGRWSRRKQEVREGKPYKTLRHPCHRRRIAASR